MKLTSPASRVRKAMAIDMASPFHGSELEIDRQEDYPR